MKTIKTALYWDTENTPQEDTFDWKSDRERRLHPEKTEYWDVDVPEEFGDIEEHKSKEIPEGKFISDEEISAKARQIFSKHTETEKNDGPAISLSLNGIAEALHNREKNIDVFFKGWGTQDLDQLAGILQQFVNSLK